MVEDVSFYAFVCQESAHEAFEKQMDLAVRLHNNRLEGVPVSDEDIALLKEIMAAQKQSYEAACHLATLSMTEDQE